MQKAAAAEGTGEDDLRFEEFEALIEQQEDESSNKIAELRAANYVGSKGSPMWHLRNSIKTGEQAISFFAKLSFLSWAALAFHILDSSCCCP